ncbi:MAG: type IV pilus twitching motility protein PilT [Myxococcota bacterium]
MDRERLHRLLRLGFEKGASDIHFQAGYLPLYRFNGELVELRYRPLSAEDTESLAQLLVADSHIHSLDGLSEVDLAYEIPGEGRFRVNISRERKCFNIVLRVIPLDIKNFAELNLPTVVQEIAPVPRGLVLVTGATGMGKSTTLAAMLQEINRTRKCKIVTIEDPIEFIFKQDRSIITQREVGTDTPDFPSALRAALRQDPDVIMVGEIRDAETVDTALKAAETGHAVLSSIHTSDVVSTMRRLLNYFGAEDEMQVRERIAENVQGIISLRLLPNKQGNGRVPAVEIMRTTRTIRECIRDPNRTLEIPDHIAKGREHMKMQTFDQHLLDLYQANKIKLETACDAASNPRDFATQLALEGDVPYTSEGEVETTTSVELKEEERF